MLRHVDPGGKIYGAVGTSNVNLNAYWTTSLASVWSVSAGNGRTGSSSLRMSGVQSAGGWVGKQLDNQPIWGVVFAFRMTAFPSVTLGLCTLIDGSTLQLDLRVNASGTLSVTRNGTVLATSTNYLFQNIYYHIEFKATIHNTAGNYEVRVNGITWIPAQGGTANTRTSANNYVNFIYLGNSMVSNGNSITWDFDDVIIYDGQTTDAQGNTDISDFIGDCGVTWLLPSGAGTTTQFTPDSGSNYARVADTTIDGDTSYVQSSTVNNIDSYALTDLPAGKSQVKSVALINYCRKTDTGSRQAKALVRTASTNYLHTNAIALYDSYVYNFQNWGSNPNTTSTWSTSDVNALEIGQKVTA